MELYSRSDRCHTRRWLRLVAWRINKHREECMHKQQHDAANFAIREESGRFRVYDRNGHGRLSFATRAAAQEWITAQRSQPAVQTSEAAHGPAYV